MAVPDRRTQRSDRERRSFLKGAINGIVSLLALLVTGFGVVSLLPRGGKGRREEFFPVADEDDAPRRGARAFLFTYRRDGREVAGRVFLARAPEGLIALSPSCTHLGCFVVWRQDAGEFACPCHGGRYDIAGRNIDGPPPRPLTRLALENRDGRLFVGVPL